MTSWLLSGKERVRRVAGRVVLAAVTAGVAWWVSELLLGQPGAIFAPIAAIVCLIDDPGVRGRRALRLLVGVLVGVVVGELFLRFLGTGPWQIALSAAVPMALTALVSTNPLALIQSGVAALLVVGQHAEAAGTTRLWSALIGGALALTVSQVLATPSPLALLRGAANSVFTTVATSLRRIDDALGGAASGGAVAPADAAHDRMRDGLSALAALAATRGTTRSITRHSLRGRWERHPRESLDERLAGIEELYATVLLTAATASRTVERGAPQDPRLAPAVADLARAVGLLADRPTEPDAYRDAHELAAAAAAELDEPVDADPTRELDIRLRLAVRQVATYTADAAHRE